MLRINFHRAAVAFVLMATLLAPFGTCGQLSPRAKHSCCPNASDHSPAFRTDCCTVRTTDLAVVSDRVLPIFTMAQIERKFARYDDSALFYDVSASPLV